MIKTNMNLSELPARHDRGEFLRSIAAAVLQFIIEAFNSRLRQQCLNASWFLSMADARQRISWFSPLFPSPVPLEFDSGRSGYQAPA